MKQSKNVRINDSIRSSQVLLIDSSGENLGVVNTSLALNKAREESLDLVEVGQKDKTPVCKIMDYGKYKYELSKKERENKKHKTTTKEIKFRPNTGDNDLTYRAKRAKEFLEDGNKVKLVVRFRGREIEHKYETGKILLDRFLEMVECEFRMDNHANVERNQISVTLSPEKESG